jgi:uncharacterized protein YjbJ (UPF0337 family)
MERLQFDNLWNQAKGEVRRVFGKLTDEDMKEAEGGFEKLIGRVQQRYGETKEAAAARVAKFFESIRSKS